MAYTGTPAVIKRPDGALALVYRDGSIVRIERDGSVTVALAVRPILPPFQDCG